MRIALGVEYHGARYCGWQSQANGCGIQDHMQHALSKIAEHPVQVICAGRTDTGVHAFEQVIHFDTDAERPLSAWVRGTNANLPNDIASLWACPVGAEFHARFSAISRRYRYILLNRPQRPALAVGRVGWYHQTLDLDAMQRAAQLFVGRHDFNAFRSSECQAKSPIKTMHSFQIERSNDRIVFDLHADGFLHHMVRNLVGCLVYVGSARGDNEWIEGLLASRDRKLAPPTFAPDGLYLSQIEYDTGWALPQRQSLSNEELLAELAL
jgi:tRNA pseudouridine38-40 synthase